MNKKEMEKKIPWTIIGTIITILAFVFAILTFIDNPKAKIEYKIINVSNVIDIHKPLESIEVYFNGEDIRKINKNLKIYTIKVMNSGRKDILENHYSSKLPWGIQFKNCEIVGKPNIVETNSDFLLKHILNQIQEDNLINFEKLIFEKDDFFTLEVLVLHKKNRTPKLSILGKIAGVEKNIIETLITKKENFFESAFSGNILIQIIRLILYFVILIILFVALFFLSEKLNGIKASQKEKVINLFKDENSLSEEDIKHLYILNEIEQLNSTTFYLLKEKLNDEHIRNNRVKEKLNDVFELFIIENGDGSFEINQLKYDVLLKFAEYCQENYNSLFKE